MSPVRIQAMYTTDGPVATIPKFIGFHPNDPPSMLSIEIYTFIGFHQNNENHSNCLLNSN